MALVHDRPMTGDEDMPQTATSEAIVALPARPVARTQLPRYGRGVTIDDSGAAERAAAAADAIGRLINHSRGERQALRDRDRSVDADLAAGMTPPAIAARNRQIAIDLGATTEELDGGVLGLSEASVRQRRRVAKAVRAAQQD